jgi:hypothetical protein
MYGAPMKLPAVPASSQRRWGKLRGTWTYDALLVEVKLSGLLPDGRPFFRYRSDGALFALWFDPDSVVHGRADALLAAEISLGGLDRNMAKQELNLLKFASR